MTGVVWLGEPTPVFPYPEDAQALIDDALGITGLYAALPTRGRVAAPRYAAWNAALMRAFEAAATERPARLTITRNVMTEHVAALGGAPLTADGAAREYDIFLLSDDGEAGTLESLRQTARPVRLTLDAVDEPVRTPGYGPAPHRMPFPRADEWAAHVTRWPHLLWLLQAAPHALRQQRGGGRNVIGANVRIHHTAHVDGSVLMDGVDVDAHATIINSFLGRDVRVADHTSLHQCVVGPGCNTLADSFFRRVVALPQSTLSNLDLVEVILGRQVFITAGVIFFRGTPNQTVRVGQVSAHEEDSGRAELGGAVGHRCVLGTRAIFAPGRAVPGGTVIVMRPEEGVMHLPEGLPPNEPVAWDEAALVPVRSRWPGYQPAEVEPDER